MAEKKRGLGRGLNELLSPANWLKGTDIQLFYCPIDRLLPNPYQPRQNIRDGELDELVESVRSKGILQPILVTRTADRDRYQIIAGERRWRAAGLAGLGEVPVLLREATSSEALEFALIENIQRKDLNCIEEALAIRKLQEEFHLTQQDIADRVGRDRSTVANLLRILQLPGDIQEKVLNDAITMGHARALLSLPDAEAQRRLCGLIVSRGLSVRETEQLAARGQAPPPPKEAEDPGLAGLSRALQDHLGVKVRLKRKGARGGITLSFRSEQEFRALLDRLGLNSQ
ncbi:MAG TPA: ParB/RepB/Spo0J family partition protein [Syntrophobacter fumaroxidans]|nr:ParB/RepB/Spo0J family partition protein [Syntrophobacter fumaroxidans]